MTKIATREAYGNALAQLGEQDERVVVLDCDLSGSTKTSVFAKKFPERFFNIGVAEQNMIGIASGMARQGLRPFASTFAVFAAGRAFEPIRQQIAYASLPVKIVASHGGITVGEDGGSHQTVEDLAIMRSLPNMVVLCPADATETTLATKAIHASDAPVFMRTGRLALPVLFDDDYAFEIGKASVVHEGTDGTIIACGVLVHAALDAAKQMAAQGTSVRVLNMATIKPIDRDAVIAATKTGWIVTAEEGTVMGGLGSAVTEVVCETNPVPVIRVGMQDEFGTSGKGNELLDHFGLNAQGIVTAIQRAQNLAS